MEIQEILTRSYECPLCGTIYHSPDAAKECFEFGQLLNKFAENDELYKWVNITRNKFWLGDGKTSEWHFIRSIKIRPRYSGESVLCNDKEIVCYQINFSLYGSDRISSSQGKISPEFESIKEHYERTGEIPGPYSKADLVRLPKEVIKDINECILDKRAKVHSEFELYSKEYLIELLEKHESIFTKYEIIDILEAGKGFAEPDSDEECLYALLRNLGDFDGK